MGAVSSLFRGGLKAAKAVTSRVRPATRSLYPIDQLQKIHAKKMLTAESSIMALEMVEDGLRTSLPP